MGRRRSGGGFSLRLWTVLPKVRAPCECASNVRGEQHHLRECFIPSVSVDGRTPRFMLTIRRVNGARRMERMAFRAQTIFADMILAALAFGLAYLVAISAGSGAGPGEPRRLPGHAAADSPRRTQRGARPAGAAAGAAVGGAVAGGAGAGGRHGGPQGFTERAGRGQRAPQRSSAAVRSAPLTPS